MEPRLSLITLGVTDMTRSRAFYEALGFRASAVSNDEVTFFQAGALILGLFGRAALAADAGLNDAPPPAFRGVSIAHNTRTRDEVDAVMAEAEAAGAMIVKPAEEVFWGGYSGYFTDPDGHLWEIAWNPGFPIAGDGSITLPE